MFSIKVVDWISENRDFIKWLAGVEASGVQVAPLVRDFIKKNFKERRNGERRACYVELRSPERRCGSDRRANGCFQRG